MSTKGCYCANYYGSINCRNTVYKFGERCKLCLALKSGASLSEGLLPDDDGLGMGVEQHRPSPSGLPMPMGQRPHHQRSDGSSRSSFIGWARSNRAPTLSKN
ncbi:hypothetical protein QBC46DRAFT_378247 [Diplogelasinospora grovesii]|uniref:Uncharacterized protein n=1 Tax=Diplogelasinospora grovesii TaxID=303347 RepID=A0AAN6NG74_9PEZI|nr:hypothetical protein QBC46DRAFT_378247 [Diplogelasinospora grovesii]